MVLSDLSNSSAICDDAAFDKVKVPVLTYHSIDDSGSVISTSPAVFRQQMRAISDHGFRTLTLGELSQSLRKLRPISPDSIVLTFDDGFANSYTEAFSVLQEHELTATVFLVADHCGGYNDWQGNPPSLPRSKLLSWKQIREMNAAGIEFGSHTLSHPDLSLVSIDKAKAEIEDSKKIIEDATGSVVESFAYPFGSITDTVKQLVRQVYGSACSTHMGKVTSNSDPYALERVDTFYLSNPRAFRMLPTRAMDGYLAFRELLRSVKATVSR